MEWISITDKLPRNGKKCIVMGPSLNPDHVFIVDGATWNESSKEFEKFNGFCRQFHRIKGFNYESKQGYDHELVTHWIGLKE